MAEQAAQDAVFADLAQALDVARCAHRVKLTPAVSGLQACYYVGDMPPPADAPPNLIHVPIERLSDYFARTRNRFPSVVVPGPAMKTVPEKQAYGTTINLMLRRAVQERQRATIEALNRYRTSPRSSRSGRALRVFAAASRETTVMQYSSTGLIRGFEKLGHEVRFEIESDEMQRLDLRHLLDALESFAPDLVLNINHQNAHFIPPWVVNAVWWQDLMQPLRTGEKIAWRQNDLVYTALTNHLGPAIVRSGLPEARLGVQPFCIDTDMFQARGDEQRANKVVFVGSSASIRRKGLPGEEGLIEQLSAMIEAGEMVSEERVHELAKAYGLEPDHAFHSLFYIVMRDHLVRWLCRVPGVRVEVYGRYWDRDPVVAPFFKGELPHGSAVADVYRGAKYALIVHPLSINTQRLAEAAACGAIPVVYDCRPFADGPHWDERLLYFRTPAQLAEALTRTPPTFAAEFSDFFSYERFASRILADAAPLLS